MKSNSDLFKQAIAEAKSVREAAIANAKEALEESLTPHLKTMLAQKLQEMEDSTYEEDSEDENLEDVEGMEGLNDLETIDDADEDIDVADMSKEDLENLIRDIIAAEMGAGHEDLEGEEDLEGMEGEESEDLGDLEDLDNEVEDEEIDLDELLAELSTAEESVEGDYKKVKEEGYDTADAAGDALDKTILPALQSLVKKGGEIGAKAMKALEALGSAAGHAIRNEAEDSKMYTDMDASKDLQEALKTVRNLKEKLDEVNVLNAKLLYLTKILKSTDLSESRKVNIVAAFDKAETVKEAKLIYSTVIENLTERKTSKKNEFLKEAKMKGRMRGIRTQAGNKPEILTEQAKIVKRWQELAQINKK